MTVGDPNRALGNICKVVRAPDRVHQVYQF